MDGEHILTYFGEEIAKLYVDVFLPFVSSQDDLMSNLKFVNTEELHCATELAGLCACHGVKATPMVLFRPFEKKVMIYSNELPLDEWISPLLAVPGK